MYEELVKRLRDISNSDGNIKSNYIGLTMMQAADAIEYLSRVADAIPHVCECCVGCELEKKNGGWNGKRTHERTEMGQRSHHRPGKRGGRVMDFICPYICSYRTNSGYCGRTGGWESCQYRQLHQPNTVVGYVPPLKKTNADNLRSMTDEELADWLIMNGNGSDYQTWIDWLKQEAKEGE